MPPKQHQFKPGQSGNPSGRPKGVASQARQLTKGDPTQLLRVLLSIAKSEAVKPSDRIAAAKEFLDRGWGKAASYAPVEDGDPLELDSIDREIDTLMDELATRRQAQAPRTTEAAAVGHNGKGRAAAT